MFGWSQSSRNATEPEREPVVWPPRFRTYDEYRVELDELIKQHPPFGVWLREFRNGEHVLRKTPEMFDQMVGVRQLQRQYVEAEKRRVQRLHAMRYMTKTAPRCVRCHLRRRKASRRGVSRYDLACKDIKAMHAAGYKRVRMIGPPVEPTNVSKRRRLAERHAELEDGCEDRA